MGHDMTPTGQMLRAVRYTMQQPVNGKIYVRYSHDKMKEHGDVLSNICLAHICRPTPFASHVLPHRHFGQE